MEEIIFSVFEPGTSISYIKTMLSQFEKESHIHVRIEELDWLDGWKRLVDASLYGSGFDVSDIGNTWVMDLAQMNALRPFSPTEIEKIIAGKDYFPACWSGAKMTGAETWAIPFIGDARVVYYRKSLLKQAGVDENTAFQSISAFENTLEKLKASGVQAALSLPTQRAAINLQSLASWVWDSGGDLFSPDGKKLIFDEPEALVGIKAYFRLAKYLGERRLDQVDSERLFRDGHAAIHLSGHWILKAQYNLDPEILQDIGIASMLDSNNAFVGAEQLVVWKHSRHPEAALALIRFICRVESGEFLYPHFGLPPYKQGWNQAPFNDPKYSVQMQALQNGRSYPPSALRALVEKRLTMVMPEIWEKVFANPEQSDEIVGREITTLANRLRVTLES